MSEIENDPIVCDAPPASEERTPAVRVLDPIALELLPYGAPTAAPERRTAVLTVHGMGQQTTFQTLADVADSLGATARVRNVTMLANGQVAQRLSRAELDLIDPSGEPTEVHVYEAYWAPWTEGAVGLKDVMSFLFHAGVTNLNKLRMTRMIFGTHRRWKIDLGTPLSLLVALLTVLSLVIVNVIIGSVVALRFALKRSDWPTDQLLVDLSVPATIISVFALTLGIMILLASHVKRFSGRWQMVRPLTWILWTELTLLLAALAGAAVLMCWAMIHHRSPGASILVLKWLGADVVRNIATMSWRLVAFLIGVGMISAVFKSATLSRAFLWITTLVNVVVAAALIRGLLQDHPPNVTATPRSWWWVWILLFGVSWFARKFLVQYLGDVAAYVEPYRLDRFNALREQIKKCTFDTADAVYRATAGNGAPLHDRIVVVAHSLGSVVAYDVVNMLLRADLPRGGAIGVRERTSALITFGSPLDKIAFLFSQQHVSPTQEGLAATIQPLVQKREWHPPWINIYSRNDIISGRLDYFDDGGVRRVCNLQDPEASTPLAAHTEYWNNTLLWRVVRSFL